MKRITQHFLGAIAVGLVGKAIVWGILLLPSWLSGLIGLANLLIYGCVGGIVGSGFSGSSRFATKLALPVALVIVTTLIYLIVPIYGYHSAVNSVMKSKELSKTVAISQLSDYTEGKLDVRGFWGYYTLIQAAPEENPYTSDRYGERFRKAAGKDWDELTVHALSEFMPLRIAALFRIGFWYMMALIITIMVGKMAAKG